MRARGMLCHSGHAVRRAAIPPDRARDAFEHPFLYLPAEALELVAA